MNSTIFPVMFTPRFQHMSLFCTYACIFSLLTGSLFARAANSFAGSNLYYAAGLSSDEAETLLQCVLQT